MATTVNITTGSGVASYTVSTGSRGPAGSSGSDAEVTEANIIAALGYTPQAAISLAQNKLLGRGAASGTGSPEAITLGTNLTLSGTTLNAAGGDPTNAQVNAAIEQSPVATRDTLYEPAFEGPVLPRTSYRLTANKFAGAPTPFRTRILSLGDSYVATLENPAGRFLAPIREYGFGLVQTLAGGAAQDLAQWTRTPVGGTLWRMTGAGHMVTHGTASEVECYRVKVIYQTESGVAGTFSIQTNTASAGWVDVPGATAGSPIDTNTGSGISAAVFSYDFSTTEPRLLRAVWQSGTVRILGFVVSDIWDNVSTQKGGVGIHSFAQGGVNYYESSQCPQSIWTACLGAISPDFITYKADDDHNITQLGTIYDAVTTALPSARPDWIFISRHPSNAAAYTGQGANEGPDMLSMDLALRDFARTKNELFVNPRAIHPTNAVMIASGLTTDGNAHLTTNGQLFEENAIMNHLSKVLMREDMRSGAAQTTIVGTDYQTKPFGVSLASGSSVAFSINNRTLGSANYRPNFMISKLSNTGDTGFHYGQFNTTSVVLNQYGGWFYTYGTSGFGNGLPAMPRTPSALMELHSGNRTTSPTLSLSGASGHSGDLFRVYQSAATTTGTEGTKTAFIQADGYASFGRLKATIPSYADDAAADADSGLLSGQLYRTTAGGRTVFQKP